MHWLPLRSDRGTVSIGASRGCCCAGFEKNSQVYSNWKQLYPPKGWVVLYRDQILFSICILKGSCSADNDNTLKLAQHTHYRIPTFSHVNRFGWTWCQNTLSKSSFISCYGTSFSKVQSQEVVRQHPFRPPTTRDTALFEAKSEGNRQAARQTYILSLPRSTVWIRRQGSPYDKMDRLTILLGLLSSQGIGNTHIYVELIAFVA